MAPTGTALVARDAELAELVAAWDTAAAGTGTVAVVSGEAGVGKSRLVTELERTVRDRGIVLRGEAVPLAVDTLGYPPFLQLLRAARRSLGSAGEHLPLDLTDRSVDSVIDVFMGALDDLTARQPTVVIVEDLHWTTPDSCAVLSVLARLVGEQRALLVMTCRSADLAPTHHARRLVAELARTGLAREVSLGRFGVAAVADQIEALTGTNPEASVLADVYERSGGNPLLVEEVVLTGAPVDDLGPGRLDELVVARVEQLSLDGRQLAEAVAIVGGPVAQRLLADFVEWEPGRFVAALREAIDAQVLSVSPGDERVVFRHVLLAEAVVGAMLAIERRACHVRWAEVLEAAGPPAPEDGESDSDRLQLVARHHALSGRLDRSAPADLAIARSAESVLAFGAARVHYERLLDAWPHLDDPAALLDITLVEASLRAAEAANRSGGADVAVRIMDRVLTGEAAADVTPAWLPLLRERRAWYLRCGGSIGPAMAAYDSALGTLVSLAPDQVVGPIRTRVLAGCVRRWELSGQLDEAIGLAARALEVAEPADLEGQALAGSMLGQALIAAGRYADAEGVLVDAAARAEEVRDAGALVTMLRHRTDAASRLGRVEDGLAAVEAASVRLRAAGAIEPLAILLDAVAGELLYRLARFDASAAKAEVVLAESTAPIPRAAAHALTGVVRLERLELADAHEHLERARMGAVGLADSRLSAGIAMARAELATVAGRFGTAQAAVSEGVNAVEHSGDYEALARLLALAVQVEADRAAAAVGRRAPTSMGSALVDRMTRRLRELNDATGDPVVALAAEQAALDHERLLGTDAPARWSELAAAWNKYGFRRLALVARLRQVQAALGRVSERVDAAGDLVALHSEVVEAGSALLTAAAERTARAAGVPLSGESKARARGSGSQQPGFAELTRREREVLELVSSGATNRQIGAQLYISEKTASVHVSRILAKLGVSGREEAARLHRQQRAGR